MNCPNCGRNIPDNSNACGYCGVRFGAPVRQQYASNGAPRYAAPAPTSAVPKKKNLGLILGLSIGGAVFLTIITVIIVMVANMHDCYECDDKVFGGELVDGEYFCDDCYDDLPECSECDKKVSTDGENYWGNYICDDCLEDLGNSLLDYGYYY